MNSSPTVLQACIEFALALLISVLVTHVWAALQFLFFRFSAPETPARQQRFLARRYGMFTNRWFSKSNDHLNASSLRRFSRYWFSMSGLSVILLSRQFDLWIFAVACGNLFFAGLFLSQAWYGLRCLRLLGLETFSLETTTLRNGQPDHQ